MKSTKNELFSSTLKPREPLYVHLTEGKPGIDQYLGENRHFYTFYYRGHDPLNGVGGILEQVQLTYGFQEVAVITDDQTPVGVTAVIRGYEHRMSYTERLTGFSYDTP